MRGKIFIKKMRGRRLKIKVRHLILALVLTLTASLPRLIPTDTKAASCPDLKIVFARGSGGERWTTSSYIAFKDTLEEKLATTNLSYEFTDLDYPAVGIGFASLEAADTTVGAFFSGGEAYTFGKSVKIGVENLKKLIREDKCANTKYVLGGYSQGGMVLQKTLSYFNPEQVIYMATFGDPKIYLPEGKGIIPAACRGENLSDYRMHVPDCRAYKGILGAYIPYEPEAYVGKIGTWCNKRDALCSSHLSVSDHVGYVEAGLYEDASKVIFDKICRAFGIENRISSPHDTAILIDTTSAMMTVIDRYKNELARLAAETFDVGGRIALYYYRGANSGYEPVKYCDFETCTMAAVKTGLEQIRNLCAGDAQESLMSASFHTMAELNWRQGATKSLIVLTDAGFATPDRQGMSFDEVVRMSKMIDPVNFYIITEPELKSRFNTLATATDGQVATNLEEARVMMDYILARYDSLPRVEETLDAEELPVLSVNEVTSSDDEVKVRFTNTGTRALVALDDAILGVTNKNEIVINEVDLSASHVVALVPLGNDVRGEAVEVVLDAKTSDSVSIEAVLQTIDKMPATPKAPNTGKH